LIDQPKPKPARLTVLAVDDERPALEELTYLLAADGRIGEIRTASSSAEALRVLADPAKPPVDALFLDIRMPGETGLDLAGALNSRPTVPQIVFVTAHEDFAVSAFEFQACDYLLKPVRQDRLAEAIRRIGERVHARDTAHAAADEIIPVELAGITRFLARSQVRYVEAHGDYARLHTCSHLVRISLSTLEDRWSPHGFVRVHRSFLIALRYVSEVRWDAGHTTVTVGGKTLAVSRRHAHELRERLVGELPAKP
jgi:DNA-binding LytR/AlgR family response regulator